MVTYFSGLDQVEGVATLATIVLAGALVSAIASRRLTGSRPLLAILASLYIDAVMLLVLSSSNGQLANDAVLWHNFGVDGAEHMQHMLAGEASEPPSKEGKEGYVWILGTLYLFGGATPMLGIALNVALRVFTVLAMMFTVKSVLAATSLSVGGVNRIAAGSGIITALMPAFAFWSPQLLRESITIFLMVGALGSATRFVLTRRPGALLFLAAMVLILGWVRQSLGISFGFAVSAGIAYCLLGQSARMASLRIWLLVISIPLFPVALQSLMSIVDVDSDGIVGGAVELSEESVSGFPGLAEVRTVPEVLLVSFPRVFMGPFPWELSANSVMLLALMEQLCWITTAFFSVLAVHQFKRKPELSPASWIVPLYVITAVALIVGFSITVGNYGLLARFRPMATASLLPVACIGAYFWFMGMRRSNRSPIDKTISHTK